MFWSLGEFTPLEVNKTFALNDFLLLNALGLNKPNTPLAELKIVSLALLIWVYEFVKSELIYKSKLVEAGRG